jgi:N-acylneuraminate cytidylyltransferase
MSSGAYAVIPARGGSKSVPRKNVRVVGGKPLIAYTIEVARACKRVERVIVSTDDAEIASVARQYGAEVPFVRPAEFATDLATDLQVFQHALGWFAEHEGREPELLVHLRATAPLRPPQKIDEGIDLIRSRPDVDSLRAVELATQSPYKMWLMGDDGLLAPVVTGMSQPEHYNLPRQVLPLVYWQNGFLDIYRPSVIRERGLLCGERILPFVVDPIIDVDYEENVQRLEQVLAGSGGPEPVAPRPGGPGRHPS